MNDPASHDSAGPKHPGSVNPTFVHAVGVLLLTIIAALAGLTIQYRRRALAAEWELHRVYKQLGDQEATLRTFLELEPGQRVRIIPEGEADAPAAVNGDE